MKGQLLSALLSASLHVGLGLLMLSVVRDIKPPQLQTKQSIELHVTTIDTPTPAVTAAPSKAQVKSQPKPEPERMAPKRITPPKTISTPKPPIERMQKPVLKAPAIPKVEAAPMPKPSPTQVNPQKGNVSAVSHTQTIAGTSTAANSAISNQLQPVAYQHNPPPAYPEKARRRKQQGTVLLDVLVCEQGTARHVNIARSSGYILLDKAATQAVKRWRFTPARKEGQQIAAHVTLPIAFKIE